MDSPLISSSNDDTIQLVPPQQTHNTYSIKISDVVAAILILGIGAAVGYAIYKLKGRIDVATCGGAGSSMILGGSYITYRVCTHKKTIDETPSDIQQTSSEFQPKVTALPMPRTIEEAQGSKILEKTIIAPYSEKSGFHVPISAEIIDKQGLGPKYEITIYGQTLYLSDVFDAEGVAASQNRQKQSLSALAYIPSNENPAKYVLRLFYYSSIEGIWYSAVNSNRFSQLTHSRDVTVLPLEINLALEAVIENKAPLVLQGKTPEKCSFPYGKCFQLSIPEFTEQPWSQNEQKLHTQLRHTEGGFFTSSPGDVSHLSESNVGPDFNKAVFYTLRGPYFKEGFYVVVPGLKNNYSYVFLHTRVELLDDQGKVIYQEKNPHPVLAFVQFTGKNQTLTDFGTLSRVVETLTVTIPALSKSNKIPLICTKNSRDLIDGESKPYQFQEYSDLSLYPTWNGHRERFPILKDFMRSLNL